MFGLVVSFSGTLTVNGRDTGQGKPWAHALGVGESGHAAGTGSEVARDPRHPSRPFHSLALCEAPSATHDHLHGKGLSYASEAMRYGREFATQV